MSSALSLVDERVDILGVGVSCVNLDDAVLKIEGWISAGDRNYVCVTSVHGVIESRRNACLRGIHNHAGMVTPDGLPLVWFARLLGRKRAEQVCGLDLMRQLTAVSELRGYRQYYYGGADGLLGRLQRTLLDAHPKLEMVGAFSPPFRELTGAEDDEIVTDINAARPDIVWVGLGSPKQELWMANHIGRVDAAVMIGVGAAFDFLAGTKRRAPVWIRRVGLEWLFRLCSEPRRLWRRYAHIVPAFLALAAWEFALLAYRRARVVGASSTPEQRAP